MCFINKFRRLRKGENKVIHYSPTDMSKCPIILRKKKIGKYVDKFSDATLTIFAGGNKVHVLEGIYRKGSMGHIDTEKHMSIIENSGKYIFSGYADFVMIDHNGLYLEDLKSCNKKAFYFFQKEKGSASEKIQISAYRYLYYIVFGVIIERGVITKIDRDNTLNRMSLEIEMLSIKDMENYITNHPTIRRLLNEITDATFNKETYKFIKGNRWVCQ